MRWCGLWAVLLGGCSLLVSQDESDPSADAALPAADAGPIVDLCPSGWSTVGELTIDARLDDPTNGDILQDVPVAVLLSPDQRAALQLAPSLADIRLADRGANELDFEIEFVGDDARDAVIWVRIPDLPLNTQSASLLVFGGNPDPGPLSSNPAGVWMNNYLGVWHLGSETAGVFRDSTGSSLDAVDGAPDGLVIVEGKLGDGLEGSDESSGDDLGVTFATPLVVSDQLSIETWYARTAVNTMGTPEAVHAESETDTVVNLRLADNNDQRPKIQTFQGATMTDTTVAQTPNEATVGQWLYLAGTVDIAAEQLVLYENGAVAAEQLTEVSFVEVPLDPIASLEMANDFRGLIDEIRLATDARSPAWFEIQYRSMTGELLDLGEVDSCR